MGKGLELSAGQALRVAVYGKNHTGVFFDAHVVVMTQNDRLAINEYTLNECYLVGLIRENGGERIVNFESNAVRCEVLVPATGDFLYDIRIHRMRLPIAGDVHVIVLANRIGEINRRSSFRLWVGVVGVIEKGREAFSVTIRDVSSGGVGFFAPPNCDIQMGDTLKISFADSSSDQSFWFATKATVVRIVGGETGPRIIGCSFVKEQEDIHDYVHKKQIDRIRLITKEGKE